MTEEAEAEQIEGFRVTYGRDISASDSSVEVGPLEQSVELQSLQPDTFYYLKVFKFNAAGRGESVSRSLQTLRKTFCFFCVFKNKSKVFDIFKTATQL